MKVAQLYDIPRVGGEDVWIPVRDHMGIRAFGVNAWHGAKVGDEVIEDHDEQESDATGGHEELYLVLRGRATFTVDGTDVDAPAGTLLLVAPHERRVALAAEDDTSVLVIGATPGEAFTPSEWELRELSR